MLETKPFDLLLVSCVTTAAIEIPGAGLTRVMDLEAAACVMLYAKFDLIVVYAITSDDPGWLVVSRLGRLRSKQRFAVITDCACPYLKEAARSSGAVAVAHFDDAEAEIRDVVLRLRGWVRSFGDN